MKSTKKLSIVVTDSGVGGLPALKALALSVPFARFIYYSDEKNMPYGNKGVRAIEGYCEQRVRFAKSVNADLLVVACNTMSVVGKSVFSKSDVPVLTVVAADAISEKTIVNAVLFCTAATAKSERIRRLSAKNGVFVYPFYSLACEIEKGVSELERARFSELEKMRDDNTRFGLKKEKYNTVVLGCTHYGLIKGEFKKLFPNAAVIDGSEDIAKRAMEILCFSACDFNDRFVKPNIVFRGSGARKVRSAFYKIYAKDFATLNDKKDNSP